MEADASENYPSFKDVVKRLNKLSRDDLKDMSSIESVDILTRVHLNQFLKDWLSDDNGLGEYQRNIPPGYPRDDALMLGDLLVYLMVGGDKIPFGSKKGFERPYIDLEGGGKMQIEARYADDLAKMRSKMPEGKSFSDMVGVHAIVLYSLPQRKFHRYNIEQIFKYDPSLADSFFETKQARISPADFETLMNLKNIVERGAIEQFRLAMSTGTQGLKSLASQGSTFGQVLMDAYRVAESAVAYFQKGDFPNAVQQLQTLQTEYKVGAGAFASNINNIFVATISTLMNPIETEKGSHYSFDYKGNQTPVLMSLSTQFVPEKGPSNILNAARGAARVASGPAYAWNSADKNNPAFVDNTNDGLPEKGKSTVAGTNGQKAVMWVESNNKNDNFVAKGFNPFVTTDWGAIFAGAYAYGNVELAARSGTNASKLNEGYKAMFDKGRRPILKFYVHGTLEYGVTNLMPTGILTVALSQDKSRYFGKKFDNKYAMGGYAADLFYESFSADDDLAEEFAKIVGDDTNDGMTDFDPSMLDTDDPNARRRARKRPSKKKPSQGQMIAIDLVPASQIRLSTVVNKADWYKARMKEDETGMLKQLWDEFARGAPDVKRIGRKWFWKGKYYNTRKEANEAKRTMDLTYADKKKGQANMNLIYAKRKDNGQLVPFRLFVPKTLLRRRQNDLLPKKAGYYGAVKYLLEMIEEEFGKIKFKRVQEGQGGYNRETAKGTVSVDRGVHMIFQTEGLDAGPNYSTKAHPSRVKKDGSMVYQAMMPTGTSVELEVTV